MFLCHRGSKRSSPGPQEETNDPYHLSSPCESISPSDSSNGNEWRLPSILTAGSLDELPNALPGVPVMPPVLEAQLAAATAAEAVSAEQASKKSVPGSFTDADALCLPESLKKRRSKRRPMLSSVSMHSLLNPVLDFTRVDQSRTNPSMEEVSFSDPLGFVNRKANYYGISTDGSLSLPLASSGTRKKYQYSGMSLLSLGQRSTSTSRSTLKKLLSLDVDSFSYLMDFEERYTDPWVGSIS
ncbi:unnamed protein product [Dibothriocephalus latus]|uniref:Uncharacterized protein n=1 Tax=Dibothriocephalus latus TaxID=60516 RepID=A0A3P7LCK9_DIBLA|nr:unnamed protein product [Dibothriocephalus latus]